MKELRVRDARIEPRGVVVEVRPLKRKSRCGLCGRPCPRYDSCPPRLWRHLALGRTVFWLSYAPRRVECPQHGVRVEQVPWTAHDSHFTREFVTPLRMSAEVGNLDMALLLLGVGATRTINDWGGLTGYTALGHAARQLDLPMIKLLLDAGAAPKVPDEDGRPAHYRLPPRAESDSQTWDAAFELLGGAKDRMPL